MLNLTPDVLFGLTLFELYDMVNSKINMMYAIEDRETERVAWSTSLIMSSSGNYKKGVDFNKLYKRNFDDLGRPVKTDNNKFQKVDKESKDKELQELFAKFNK